VKQVTVEARDLITAHHDILVGILLLKRLRAADIPVKGSVCISGVESGTLTWTEDAFGNYVFTWTE
jgi:hypothetical protein